MYTKGPSMVQGFASNVSESLNRMIQRRFFEYVIDAVAFPSPSLTKVAALLSRSGNVETHGTSKYRTPSGYHHLSAAPADFGLDVQW